MNAFHTRKQEKIELLYRLEDLYYSTKHIPKLKKKAIKNTNGEYNAKISAEAKTKIYGEVTFLFSIKK